MRYELSWAEEAIKDLRKLERVTADRITKKVIWFSEQTSPLRHAEPLVGNDQGLFRFRVGEYRVLFEKDDKGNLCVLMVLRVKHRREVYR